jgi:hypothetical protein
MLSRTTSWTMAGLGGAGCRSARGRPEKKRRTWEVIAQKTCKFADIFRIARNSNREESVMPQIVYHCIYQWFYPVWEAKPPFLFTARPSPGGVVDIPNVMSPPLLVISALYSGVRIVLYRSQFNCNSKGYRHSSVVREAKTSWRVGMSLHRKVYLCLGKKFS